MSRALFATISLYLLAGCGEQPQEAGAIPDMPRFAEERLAKGRSVWMGTCRNCHLLGVSGAPAVTDRPAWAPRIEKGAPALYRSALSGIKGDDGKYRMPPRGGNDRLKDEQVRQAVDYMIASVEALVDK
ncbi:MAG: c-type cytochrome [Candidatus Thiodiazotropha taylori]|nr:c-type cytochrome [Candidatus Thiodiazotropha taylori]MCG8096838.1 c-type cytochrome [Candidatus Thiodiazotropha endolucinida]MCG7880879.1 c-type cytochrome [Candidatus Thiodiazotropha taylori]MCG7888009.1 c-type cytochrome [Candidatus Thiodiazotropha taylori]MCG7891462.1 c-type cytochrome [Candidatus Thiodiazotropha taylori]